MADAFPACGGRRGTWVASLLLLPGLRELRGGVAWCAPRARARRGTVRCIAFRDGARGGAVVASTRGGGQDCYCRLRAAFAVPGCAVDLVLLTCCIRFTHVEKVMRQSLRVVTSPTHATQLDKPHQAQSTFQIRRREATGGVFLAHKAPTVQPPATRFHGCREQGKQPHRRRRRRLG